MCYFNKIKVLILFVLISFLCFVCYLTFKKDTSFIFSNQIYNDDLVLDVFIDGKLCAYDSKTNTYFYSGKYNNNSKLNFNSLYELEYIMLENNSNVYTYFVYNDEFYDKVNIVFTSIPIVDVRNLNIKIFDSYNYLNIYNSLFTVNNNIINKELGDNLVTHFIDPELGESYYTESSIVTRGSSSIWFDKKAYKLSFNEKISIFDLPSDDKYVLDALYVDKSKIRNMLSGDLWNSINDNQTINNDLKGTFVELFYNNEYLGLYVMKEKVDKSVSGISNEGTLVKSIFHINDDYINSFKLNNFSIINNMFLNYEVKHFNEKSTNSLILHLSDYYNNNESFKAIEDNFNLENYFNYKIFVSLINGGDNVSYNQYYSLFDNDSKILITPWDMDLTWGLNWNDFTRIRGVFTMETSCDPLWMEVNILKNMDEESILYLKQRYWELRKDVITMDIINKYLDNYKDILINSGAASRDSYKWYKYDVSEEIEKIRTWANNRINFLDQYFKI